MSIAEYRPTLSAGENLPRELVELRLKLSSQPENIRADLEPFVEEAMEGARFRNRVLDVARDALEQFKLDLELTRFDLDATRRERETLLRILRTRLEDADG
jgi:hypothetical protein